MARVQIVSRHCPESFALSEALSSEGIHQVSLFSPEIYRIALMSIDGMQGHLNADYICLLFHKDSFEIMKFNMGLAFKDRPFSVIACCLDDESYDQLSECGDQSYTWWTIETDQVLSLIREGAKPFVNNSTVEV